MCSMYQKLHRRRKWVRWYIGVIGSGLKNGSFILNSNGVFGYRTVTGHWYLWFGAGLKCMVGGYLGLLAQG